MFFIHVFVQTPTPEYQITIVVNRLWSIVCETANTHAKIKSQQKANTTMYVNKAHNELIQIAWVGNITYPHAYIHA